MAKFDAEKRTRWEAARAVKDARKAASHGLSAQPILAVLASPHQLWAWLRTKPAEAIVGSYQTPDDTILANFLWERLGTYVMTFGLIAWLFDQDDTELDLPRWCGEFTSAEAEHFRTKPSAPGLAAWTAAEALAMLEAMLPGLEDAK